MADPAPPPTADRANLALLVAGLGVFMVFLDTQILFVAFGDIEASFSDVSTNTMSWVLSGYTLVFAALLVPAGRLADRWGRKRMFLGGLAVFTIASALCGLAPSAGLLIAGRVVQAIGAAALTPTSLALVLRAMPTRASPDRRRHLGLDERRGRRLRPHDRRPARRHRSAGAGCSSSTCRVRRRPLIAGAAVLVESKETDPGPFPDLVGSAVLAPASAPSRWPSSRATSGAGSTPARSAPSSSGSCSASSSSLRSRVAGGAGARPRSVPHPELPLGQPGDGRVRTGVHRDVPRQHHVPHERWGWASSRPAWRWPPGRSWCWCSPAASAASPPASAPAR